MLCHKNALSMYARAFGRLACLGKEEKNVDVDGMICVGEGKVTTGPPIDLLMNNIRVTTRNRAINIHYPLMNCVSMHTVDVAATARALETAIMHLIFFILQI